MPAVKIRAAGTKPAAKPKPAAKRRPTALAQRKAKTAAKRKGPTPTQRKANAKPGRGPGRPRKTEAEQAEGTKRNVTGLAKTDPKAEARLLKAVKAAGDRRREAKIEHEESVNALYEVAKEALEAGVSMAKVSDASDISRQWLYKMGEFAGRENGGNGGGTSKAKAAPKRSTARKSTARKATPAKRGTTAKTTAAKPRTRTRIRTAA